MEELKELLTRASEICVKNINSADNIDLHDMAEQLDKWVDELNKIGKFETYYE